MNRDEPIADWIADQEACWKTINMLNADRRPPTEKEIAAARHRRLEEKTRSHRYVYTTLVTLRDRIPPAHLGNFDRLLWELHRLGI